LLDLFEEINSLIFFTVCLENFVAQGKVLFELKIPRQFLLPVGQKVSGMNKK